MILQHIRKTWIYVLPVLLVALIGFMITTDVAQAEEEYMFLTGVIKSIDSGRKLVVVDVRTTGCEGVKTFSIDDLAKLWVPEGGVVKFYIDSENCPRKDKITKMTTLNGRGK